MKITQNEDGIYSITNRMIAEVVKKEDEYLIETLKNFAQKISIEYGEEVQLILIDESMAREVINLGVQEYLKRHNKTNENRF